MILYSFIHIYTCIFSLNNYNVYIFLLFQVLILYLLRVEIVIGTCIVYILTQFCILHILNQIQSRFYRFPQKWKNVSIILYCDAISVDN